MSKRKMDAKAFAAQKRNRRKMLTFMRMCRYGVNNFSRNTWLTVAATAVMTITLLIVFATIAARGVLLDTVQEVSNQVDMSIYLKGDTSAADANKVKNELEKLSNVRTVRFISSEQAREANAEANKDDNEVLDAINEASNRYPATLRINLIDINDTTQLDSFVKENKTIKPLIDEDRPASFAGERREAIKSIASGVTLAERAGAAATLVFVTISSLIVFNTIRMAIFNRKEEINMMKLIGADKSFIRGPFLVEAIVYGVIAAVLATIMGVASLYLLRDVLIDYGVSVQSTLDFVTYYIGLVLLGMILLGATIGVVSSLLATRRYLKI